MVLGEGAFSYERGTLAFGTPPGQQWQVHGHACQAASRAVWVGNSVGNSDVVGDSDVG